ncbi:MAG: alpha-ketoglutarate-dependent dioxygenase AlkB [Pseudomonadota bacterium]
MNAKNEDRSLIAAPRLLPGQLDRVAQTALVADIRSVLTKAPLFAQTTARGQKLSVQMSSAGTLGWVSDRHGYRYEPQHPSGTAWPPIPERLLTLWRDLLPDARTPESCLINYYTADARMGLHQDRDEADLTQPVLSISLGDDALFRFGTSHSRSPTRSVWLSSGDVVILEGPSRLAYHGIDRLREGSSTLFSRPGRVNLTLRVVT